MKKFLLVLAFIAAGLAAKAQPFLNLPSLIGDNMVLQAESVVTLWGWADPNIAVELETSWGEKASVKSGLDSKFVFRVKTPSAGFEPQSITFTTKRGGRTLVRKAENILIGQVWLCTGQSNMNFAAANGIKDMKEEIASGKLNTSLRLFTAPKRAAAYPQVDVEGNWSVCDEAGADWFSAVGYFFGDRLQKELGQPVGLVNASWGGTPVEMWTRPEALDSKAKDSWETIPYSKRDGWGIGLAYNGMIAPLTDMTVAGAIWYQGEANRFNPDMYAYDFSSMIYDWRAQFRQDLPFYFVQIAPKAYDDGDARGALVREQQEIVSKKVAKTGVVAVYDLIEDLTDIHPKYKRQVGSRLAGQVLTDVYGRNVGKVRHPSFASVEIRKHRCVVSFNDAEGGLVCNDAQIVGLEVSDGSRLYPATGMIQGDKLVVWSDKVSKPVSVRYCFGQTVGNLFDTAGLPVLPFRSDVQDAAVASPSTIAPKEVPAPAARPVEVKSTGKAVGNPAGSVTVAAPNSEIREFAQESVYFTNRAYKISTLPSWCSGWKMLSIAGGAQEPRAVTVTADEAGTVYVLARHNKIVDPLMEGWNCDLNNKTVYQTGNPEKPGILVLYYRKFSKGETAVIDIPDFAGAVVVAPSMKKK